MGPKAEMREIEVQFPGYWQTQADGDPLFKDEKQSITIAMQRMLDKTWKDQRTRDARLHGRTGGMEKFKVVNVRRNENPKSWISYFKLRAQLAEKLESRGGCKQWTAKTAATGLDGESCPVHDRAGLMNEVNEFYLFHGTKPSAVHAICKDDFALNLTGTNAGTLYGPGLYFAEASSKADEYASDDKEGIFEGLYALILCRVMCGNMHYTDAVRPNVQTLMDSIVKNRTHQSVLGDREKCRGTYREFIVFDPDQVYPEYIIIYRRVSPDDDE